MMDKWELSHWIAYFRMEPPATEQSNLQNALLCTTVANHAFGSTGKARIKEYILDYTPKSQREQRLAKIEGWKRWVILARQQAKK